MNSPNLSPSPSTDFSNSPTLSPTPPDEWRSRFCRGKSALRCAARPAPATELFADRETWFALGRFLAERARAGVDGAGEQVAKVLLRSFGGDGRVLQRLLRGLLRRLGGNGGGLRGAERGVQRRESVVFGGEIRRIGGDEMASLSAAPKRALDLSAMTSWRNLPTPPAGPTARGKLLRVEGPWRSSRLRGGCAEVRTRRGKEKREFFESGRGARGDFLMGMEPTQCKCDLCLPDPKSP